MKRKLYIISVLLMIIGGALYYFNFDALGCALILLGSSIYILTYFGTRGNKQKSHSHWSDYAVTPWDSSSDCSGS
ncbi:MAG: hypothetical protein J6T70_20910 [Bacteroidales bacterium]|nr:hypothetical protein [Bacteroidales bacterium]